MALAIVTDECVAARVVGAIAVHAPAHMAAARRRVIGARGIVAIVVTIVVVVIVRAAEERQAQSQPHTGTTMMMVMAPVTSMAPIIAVRRQLDVSISRCGGGSGRAACGHHICRLSTAEAH